MTSPVPPAGVDATAPDAGAHVSDGAWRAPRWLAAVVVLLALGAYASNLGNDFAMDDHYNVVGNAQLSDLRNVPRLFTQAWGGDGAGGLDEAINRSYWRPITATTWAVDRAIWGLNPFGYHLGNNLIHGLVSLLMMLLVGRLTRSTLAAAIAGLAFAVHPIHSEAVNLVTYRTELLCALWCLLALAIRAGPTAVRWQGPVIATCYALGLGSKEMAVTLPGWLFLVDLARSQSSGFSAITAVLRAHWRFYAGLTGVLIGYLALRVVLLTGHSLPFFGVLSPMQTAASVLKIANFYVGMLVWPWPLNPFWDLTTLRPALSLLDPEALAGLVVVILSWTGAAMLWRRNPHPQARWLAVGIAWWWLGLLPVSHLVPLPVGAGERFLYLPSAGAALALGAAVAWYAGTNGQRQRGMWAAATAVILLWTGVTAVRGTHWKDDLTLMARVVMDLPHSFNGHHRLGQLHFAAGRHSEAVASFKAADKALPGFEPNLRWLVKAQKAAAAAK
ncbi:MAG: hypothetical protein KC502_18360 [Myxococcales bacterium]|nr:hypothetical protein [Myxococcales bacterium]